MSFLGPVTTLDGHLVRPHDLEIETHPSRRYPGRIERFNRVGFEVRLDVRLIEDDGAPPVLVTLTRADATTPRHSKRECSMGQTGGRRLSGSDHHAYSARRRQPGVPQGPPTSPPDSVREPTFT